MQPARRRLLAFAVVLGATPRPVPAQRTYRIGILDPGNASNAERSQLWHVMLERLRELGVDEGRNFVVEYRWGGGDHSRLPGLARVPQVRFSIGVNLGAARAIGVTVPQSLLLRADRVIE